MTAPEACRPVAGVPLGPLTTLRVGGPAEWFVEASSREGLEAACAWAAARGLPVTLLGGGSNLVIAERGVAGLVVRLTSGGIVLRWESDSLCVSAGGGVVWDELVSQVAAEGAWGIEALSGIPGTVGATPVQNVGAYGQDVSQVVDAVDVMDRATGAWSTFAASACGFGYRDSRFRRADKGRYVIAEVRLRLTRRRLGPLYPEIERALDGAAGRLTPSRVREAVLAIRRGKGMVIDPADPDTRSAGSFFTNPVVTTEAAEACARVEGSAPPAFPAGPGTVKVPAAWLIERSGWVKGRARGRARISGKHALALVALEGAAADDVVDLAVAIKQAVAHRFGVSLTPEPILAGFGDDERVRFLEAAGR